MVTVGDGICYWIDASEVAHPLPDTDTAQFLSHGKGIIQLSPDEWKSIQKSTERMPEFKMATPMQNGPDKFILYGTTLYYLRSLSFLYKLAAVNGIKFRGKKIEEWKGAHNQNWVRDLDPDDFQKYTII